MAFSDILECRLDDGRGCLLLWTRGGAAYELLMDDDQKRYVLYKCIHFRRKEIPKEVAAAPNSQGSPPPPRPKGVA